MKPETPYSQHLPLPEIRIYEQLGSKLMKLQIDMYNVYDEPLILVSISKSMKNIKTDIHTSMFYSSSATYTILTTILDGNQQMYSRNLNLRGLMDYLTINLPLPTRVIALSPTS